MIRFGFILQVDSFEFTVLLCAVVVLCFVWKTGYAGCGVVGIDAPVVRDDDGEQATHGVHGCSVAEHSRTSCRGQRQCAGSTAKRRRRPNEEGDGTRPLLPSHCSEEDPLRRDNPEVDWVFRQFYTGMGEEEFDNLSNHSVN